ncbi:MAG TPA: nodulation protein NfeD [Candidatus Baltobacteraceae bacterium]|nr:nodulation protein NfeD [Candidatus Baltobacteraceae bacterium]
MRMWVVGALVLLTIGATPRAPAAPSASVVNVVRIDGVIGPAMARYVLRALARTARENAQALVIEIDTPGGLMKSMDDITKALLQAPVPTVAYIYPTGARAASAGVFITYAASIAAMAPTTHLGAAHPVSIAMGTGASGVDKTEMTKVTNDAAAQIRGFAIRNGRNAAWAEQAVRQSVSITDEQALRLHVIDVVADSPRDLLAKVDGRNVRTATGLRRLQTRSALVADIPMDLMERFLLLLSDPNIGFILMTLAIYGLIFELSNPGSIFPGVIGGLALVLALASFAVIEVNVAGLLLIAFAVALFIADIKVPSHGVLTAGGIAAFVAGSLLLTQEQAPFLRISLTLILTVAALTAAFFIFAVGAGVRAQARKVQTGHEALIGATGVARSDLAPLGTVFLQGELWNAKSIDDPIAVGEHVRVVRVTGLSLDVRRPDDSS